MSQRVVTFLRMHSTSFLPDVGQIDDTLPGTRKVLEGLAMVTHNAGVEVSCRVKGKTKTFLIPYTQLQVIELGEEVAKSSKAPKPE